VKPLAELTLDELLSEFSQMEDWEERCDSLIDLGFELPEMPPEEKIDANRVHGCQSHVWLTARTAAKPGQPPRLRFHVASDAMIVSGLIAVLMLMYDGKTAKEILDIDPRVTFSKLELDRHLSSQRRNGLSGMVQRIRQTAAEALVANDQ
jgi:cysteine desulfuration protein SufE